ncbi:MAG TPA: hypothetical protein VFZ78_00470 [Flavisolibacter sp.]
MRSIVLRFASFFFAALLLAGCERETEEITLEQIGDYLPLQPGKYITYLTDSTVFTNFGRNTEIHTYEEKHVVDVEMTDNLGRPTMRIYRFIRDTAGNAPWQSSGTYFVTRLDKSAEWIEENLRFVKLALPLRDGHSWKGNTYLPFEPFIDKHNFSNDDNMYDWDYTITATGETMVLGGETVPGIITVDQVNESINVPITTPTAYAAINYAVDKFAKGIGLVYQEFIMWEYQPNPGGPSPYKIGFGIKRSMIDHN